MSRTTKPRVEVSCSRCNDIVSGRSLLWQESADKTHVRPVCIACSSQHRQTWVVDVEVVRRIGPVPSQDDGGASNKRPRVDDDDDASIEHDIEHQISDADDDGPVGLQR